MSDVFNMFYELLFDRFDMHMRDVQRHQDRAFLHRIAHVMEKHVIGTTCDAVDNKVESETKQNIRTKI